MDFRSDFMIEVGASITNAPSRSRSRQWARARWRLPAARSHSRSRAHSSASGGAAGSFPGPCDSPARRTSSVSAAGRSEEHTSELQSLMRISYAVFCLKKKKTRKLNNDHNIKQSHTSEK